MKNALKPSILVLSFLTLLSACGANSDSGVNPAPGATSKWTWISGSKTAEHVGAYGTQGVPDSSNVPGSRQWATSWTDPGGRFWLLGGLGLDSNGGGGRLNDLWKYDPATLQWTWMSGSQTLEQAGIYGTLGAPAPSNVPGARNVAMSWIDVQGNLWLFGGLGNDSVGGQGALNDLWKFAPTTLEWTWVSGSSTADQTGIYGTLGTAASSNVPGARSSAASWIDSGGRLWLYGGYGLDSTGNQGRLNDLWQFDPTMLQWTWVAGSNASDQAGVYGTRGTSAPSNVPGARVGASAWLDSQGKLWLFGGLGNDSAGTVGGINDLWKFDPGTLQWTWVSGSKTANQSGTYGTLGTAAPSNVPGGRYAVVSWLDPSGNFWLFGGYGFDSTSTGYLNDLWKYDPATQQWTWVSGSKTANQSGTYGTLGTPAASNLPGARAAAVSWRDSAGKLWLFGGGGYDSTGSGGSLNDLWRFTR